VFALERGGDGRDASAFRYFASAAAIASGGSPTAHRRQSGSVPFGCGIVMLQASSHAIFLLFADLYFLFRKKKF
jgi:hypothetical protein